MSLARVDRAASAAARLPGYLRKQRWLELLAAVSAEVQEVEDMWLAMLASNAIDDATGDQLDQIGGLVDMPRGGSEDVDYRRRIRAKVAVNRSLGLVNDIIRVVRLVVNDAGVAVEIDQQGIAAYVAKLGTLAVPTVTATDLASFLRKGTSAGVRSIVESSTVADTDAFILDGPAGLGFVKVPTLDLATLALPGGTDTIVGIRPEQLDESGADPDGITLQVIVGGTSSLDESGFPDIVINLKLGSDDSDTLEGYLAASQYLFVVEPATATYAIVAGDAFGPISVAQVQGAPGGALAIAQE